MFSIDSQSRCPVYEQLVAQFEKFILTGILSPGDQIPSVRSLSMDLSVNPNTIQKAYTELDHRGIIYASPGRGCFISPAAKERMAEYKLEDLVKVRNLAFDMKLAGIDKRLVINAVEQAYAEAGGSQ